MDSNVVTFVRETFPRRSGQVARKVIDTIIANQGDAHVDKISEAAYGVAGRLAHRHHRLAMLICAMRKKMAKYDNRRWFVKVGPRIYLCLESTEDAI